MASYPNLLFTSTIEFPQFNIPRCSASDFPTYVLKKIKENATAKQSLKLMKCNKFFCYVKFPWVVVKEIQSGDYGYGCHYKTLDGKWHKSSEIVSNKLWVKEKIFCVDRYIPSLIEKIDVCDVRKLTLRGQNISYNELKFFTSSGRVQKLKIFDGVWKGVMINQILKLVPNVSSFQFVNDFPATSFERRGSNSPPTSFETEEGRLRVDKTLFPFHPTFFSDIAEVINLSKLKHFKLAFIPYVADFHVFIKFIKEHPKIKYEFYFTGKQSIEESQMLKDFSNQIKENGVTDGSCLPSPVIHYGQTQTSHRKMWELVYMPAWRKSFR